MSICIFNLIPNSYHNNYQLYMLIKGFLYILIIKFNAMKYTLPNPQLY